MRKLNINNFRDVSGYTNQYGETMKSNKIFRGAALSNIDKDEVAYMEDELGIRYILDYRDEQESANHPDVDFNKAIRERISALIVQNKKEEGFDFGAMLKGEMTVEKLNSLLGYVADGYKTMAFDNPAYHRLFELLLKDDGHIYFHCSAGKDRTGVSAFLIMIALGMSEEDAVKEYMLSNEYLRESNEAIVKQLNIPSVLEKQCEPLLFVQKESIMLTIQSIKDKYSNYDEFLLKEYQLDHEKREKLRKIYCE